MLPVERGLVQLGSKGLRAHSSFSSVEAAVPWPVLPLAAQTVCTPVPSVKG